MKQPKSEYNAYVESFLESMRKYNEDIKKFENYIYSLSDSEREKYAIEHGYNNFHELYVDKLLNEQ